MLLTWKSEALVSPPPPGTAQLSVVVGTTTSLAVASCNCLPLRIGRHHKYFSTQLSEALKLLCILLVVALMTHSSRGFIVPKEGLGLLIIVAS